MKAIAYCIRNRVKAGWHNGEWLTIMEHSEEVDANLPGARVVLDPNNRVLQRLISDIDDIYYGARENSRESQIKTPVAQRFAPESGDLEDAIGKSCYWLRVNEPIQSWFKEQIIDHPEEHPNRAS